MIKNNSENGSTSDGIVTFLLMIAILTAVISVFTVSFSRLNNNSSVAFEKIPQQISDIIIAEAENNPTFIGFGSDNGEIDIASLIPQKTLKEACAQWKPIEKDNSVTLTAEDCHVTIAGDWKQFSITGKEKSHAELKKTYMATVQGKYIIVDNEEVK